MQESVTIEVYYKGCMIQNQNSFMKNLFLLLFFEIVPSGFQWLCATSSVPTPAPECALTSKQIECVNRKTVTDPNWPMRTRLQLKRLEHDTSSLV